MTSNDDTGFDVKQNRLDRPTGWMKIARYETVRFIIDALIESPPDHKFNKSELSRRTGMSREAIREHLPLLIELGIVNEIDESGWAEYELNDNGRVTKELLQLNNAVNAVEAGQSREIETKKLEISGSSQRFVEAPNFRGAVIQPYSMEGYSETTTVASSQPLDDRERTVRDMPGITA